MASFTLSKRASTFKKRQIEIATDLFDMIGVDEFVTMCCFIDGLFTSFCGPNYNTLKHKDTITMNSRCMTRHMHVATYIIWREIERLNVTIEKSSYFKTFYDRKDLHVSNNESCRLTRENLPSRTTKEIKNIFNKHFKQ